MDKDYTPELKDIKIIKLLFKTKLSKIWLVKSEENSEICILKGKHIKSLSQYDIDCFKRERKFLELNKSDFFPKFLKPYKDNEYVYMLLNFFEGIPLSEIIRENNIKLNEFDLFDKNDYLEKKEIYLYISYQMALILNELNLQNFLHRDLKLNNIIINKNLKINLIDFGFWKDLENKNGRTKTICGTFHSMAPEIFLIDYNDYGLETDIYSYGVFLLEFFSRNCPFPYFFDENKLLDDKERELNNNNVSFDNKLEKLKNNSFEEKAKNYYFKNKKNLDFFIDEEKISNIKNIDEFLILNNLDDVNLNKPNSTIDENRKFLGEIKLYIKNLKDLIHKCLKFDPKERIKPDEILKHELFKGFEFNSIEKKFNIGNGKTLSQLLELISFNGDFKNDYLLNSKFDDVFDKYF